MIDFEVLFDRAAVPDGAGRLDLSRETSLMEAAEAVEVFFARHPEANRVAVYVEGTLQGVTSRELISGTLRGSPPIRLDECPECRGVDDHEPECSARAQVDS